MATVSRDDRQGALRAGRSGQVGRVGRAGRVGRVGPVGPFSSFWGPGFTVARVLGLGLVLWSVSTEVPPGTSEAQLAVWVLCATLAPAWLLWTATPPGTSRLQLATFVWLSAAGGAVSGLAPMGLWFVGVAAMGVATSFEVPASLAVAAAGPASAAITVWVDGRSPTVVLGAAAACLAGFLLGAGRRQHSERATQAVLLELEHDRAEVEHDRASLLSERNRLAGEVHDVLAHTLGALTVQLEALDAQLDGHPTIPSSIRESVRRTRSLASEGLAEARRAVLALREDASPLADQLERLTATSGASLEVVGEPPPLAPEATLALYRVAQEAITNATKHAPGARVTVRLQCSAQEISLSVENGPPSEPPGELSASGAGFGIDGITERVRLVGGEVSAGPTPSGWQVDARVPR